MLHNFEQSLELEKRQAQKADKFYRVNMNATSIRRFNMPTSYDMYMQHQDVDVRIIVAGKEYLVSEKFRERNFGDLYLELYSKYPTVPGWLYANLPHVIAYFMGEYVYWIKHESLMQFFFDKVFPLVDSDWFQTMVTRKQSIVSKTIQLGGNSYSINLIQAFNKANDGQIWSTIGLSLPFNLFYNYQVDIQKISL